MLSQALFYNGEQAQPLPVEIELTSSSTITLHHDTEYGNKILYFAVKDCAATTLANNLYVYVNEQKTSYILISLQHELANDLERLINKNNKSFYNKLIKGNPIILLLSLVTIIIGFYFLFFSVVPKMAANLISTEQETQLGNKMFTAFVQGETIDSTASQLVQSFGNNLQLSDKYTFKFTVVKSKDVNAFALPGGNIVIYSGIINKMKNYDELVALMGHESTHITQRHSLKNLLSSISSSIFISLVIGDGNGVATALVNNANMLKNLSYSRSLEKEADEIGMQKMMNNQVNPIGMKHLMQTLQDEDKEKVESMFKIFSTHPLTKQRIKDSEQFIATHQQNFTEKENLKVIFNQIKKESAH